MSGKPNQGTQKVDPNAAVKAAAAELLKHVAVTGYNYFTAPAVPTEAVPTEAVPTEAVPTAAAPAPAPAAASSSSSPLGSVTAALLEAAAPQLETAGKKVLEGIAAPVVDGLSARLNQFADHLANPSGWWSVGVYKKWVGTTQAPTSTPPSEEEIAAAAPAAAPAPVRAEAISSTETLTPPTDVVESTNPFDIFDLPAPEVAAAPALAVAAAPAETFDLDGFAEEFFTTKVSGDNPNPFDLD